ncbi:MAG: thiol reductant ABC exporter subunit CydC [Acidimicrobiia bacterium]|nr:thiol reductant ABC exporter subunit CydC [Acidimicrobiia bacterium]
MSRRRVIARLLDATRGTRAALIVSSIASIVGSIADIALVGLGVGSVVSLFEPNSLTLPRLLWPLGALALIRALSLYVEQYSGHLVAFRLLAELRVDFYRAIEPLAPGAISDQRSGDLSSRVVADVDRVEAFFAHTIAPAITAVVVPVIVVVATFVLIHPGAALLLVPAFGLVGFGVPLVGSRMGANAATAARTSAGRTSAHLSDGIQGLGDVIVFAYQERRNDELTALASAGSEAESDVAGVSSARSAVNSIIIGLTVIAIFAVTMDLYADGRLTLPLVAGTVAATFAMFAPLTALQELVPALDNALAAARRIFEVTDRTPVVSDPTQPGHPGDGKSLDFHRVGFTYGDGERVFDEVSLTVPPGSRVAVVGPSGTGKSTLVALALRFWDPDRGQVGVGGADVRRMTLADVRSRMAVVEQRTFLFNDTIAANLRIARPDASDADLAAAEAADIHEFIAGLPQGYETRVGEIGSRLSGGQRQRLAIARALLADTPILILDEATSDLDATTQARILTTLEEVTASKTTLVIAHRLETISDADEIIVLDHGRVVERGTHADLLRQGGAYARMLRRERDLIDR